MSTPYAQARRLPRVVILGGGFGGTYAARELGRTLGRRGDAEVVLISRENYLLFTPMLHEVAAGDLYPADIVNPLRKMLRHARFVEGEVAGIDLRARVVLQRTGTGGNLRRFQSARPPWKHARSPPPWSSPTR